MVKHDCRLILYTSGSTYSMINLGKSEEGETLSKPLPNGPDDSAPVGGVG